jgi:hypothetical protein
MTTTTEKTDIEQCEEWHIMQMCAKANGNKIYKVIVQQQQDYEIYQASFIEDGFSNKTDVKNFFMGDGCGGNRHFGNEELFRLISCFEQEKIEEDAKLHNNRESHRHKYDLKYLYMNVRPRISKEITVYPTESSRRYGSPDFISPRKRVYEEIVHPDWELVGRTTINPKRNNIKLISITEMK